MSATVHKLDKQQNTETINSVQDIPIQKPSIDIWQKKYQLCDQQGNPVEHSIQQTRERVAKALADVEPKKDREKWRKRFLWALNNGAIPAGRIISNAGASQYKPATSTINCTVSGAIPDSMDGILKSVHEAGLTLKSGAGIGYEFSTMRPNGAYVSGAGAHTSGPLSFMDIFDRMCFTVSSAGGRRGAQMATFDVGHPDVMDFIRAKREDGRLRQFNMSLLITDEFMDAVNEQTDWPLAFPITEEEAKAEGFDKNDFKNPDKIIWRDWPLKIRSFERRTQSTSSGALYEERFGQDRDRYIEDDEGRVACKVYRKVPAQRLWDMIMASTYDYAEPGFILIDRYNEMNNNWYCENIRSTNPCGEQGLPEWGACLLGSVNLTQFVEDPFTEKAKFDFDLFNEVVCVFSRMLDNVVEINGLPLSQQQNEILRKRRHGMGFTGLGSTLAMLRVPYNTDEAVRITEKISRELAVAGWEEAASLADEKGPAPIMDEEYTVTNEMLRMRPEMAEDGYKAGDRLPGRVLMARYSRYMQRIATVAPEVVNRIAEKGARYTHHSSIAPTGTISLSLANNASNGIEPSFSHQYFRNLVQEGKKSKEQVEVASFELLAYRHLVDETAGIDGDMSMLPDYFVTAENIDVKSHVDIQAAAQKWIDSSISKTINVPTDYPFEDFKGIYAYAYEKGLKGCTTFRFNPEVFQGVLVTQDDLESTFYEFKTEDGGSVKLRGDEKVEYDGEVHTAANLYDALKEGYYGKF